MSTQVGRTRFDVKTTWEVTDVVDPTADAPTTPTPLVQDGKDNSLLMETVAIDNGTMNFSLIKASTVHQGIVGLLLTGIVAATTVLLIILISTGVGYSKPTLKPDYFEVYKNQENILYVLQNDYDKKGSNLTITSTTNPMHGTAKIVNNAQRIAYTPTLGYSGFDEFNYTVSNDKARATSYVRILVLNTPPIAVAFSYQVAKNSENNTIDLFSLQIGLNKINDPDGDDLYLVDVFTESNFSSIVSFEKGIVHYAPQTGFSGEETLRYVVSDGYDTANNTLVINVENSPPKPVPYELTFFKYVANQIDALEKVTDDNGDPLRVTDVSSVGKGNAYIQDDRWIIYEPLLQYESYFDSFEYSVSDEVSTAYSYMLISIVNRKPTTENSYYTVVSNSEDNRIALSYHDEDLFDEPKIAIVKEPTNGTYVLEETSATKTEIFLGRAFVDVTVRSYVVRYTPNPRFVGNDTIIYMVTDGTDDVFGTVFINVENLAPTAIGTNVTCQKNLPLRIFASENDVDPNGDDIIIKEFTGTQYGSMGGTITYVDSSTVDYMPPVDKIGQETFEYEIEDVQENEEFALSAVGTVTVNIVNTPPVAVGDKYTVRKGSNVTLNVLENDFDPNGDAITLTSVGVTLLGTTQIFEDSIIYSAAFQTVAEIFTYTISDVHGDTSTTEVYVDVVNTPPVAVDDHIMTPWNREITFSVLENDIDEDPGDKEKLIVSSHTELTNGGNLQKLAGNVFRYTPATNFIGEDSFTYIAYDTIANSNVANVTITVYNTAPVAVQDDVSMHWSTDSVTISVLDNDYDAENDEISIIEITQPSNGNAVLNGDGTVTYSSDSNFLGTDTFEYIITDTLANTTGTVVIEVMNAIPSAIPDTASVHWRSADGVVIYVLANDFDSDPQDTISLVELDLPDNFLGNATIGADGRSVLYIPPADPFKGLEVFNYIITDGISQSSATVSVNVTNNVTPFNGDQFYNVHWSTQKSGGTKFTLFNSADPTDSEGDPLSFTLYQPEHGVTSFEFDGSKTTISYLQNTDFLGEDSFEVAMCDGLDCLNTTYYFTVFNSEPTAQNFTISSLWRLVKDSGDSVDLFADMAATDPDSEDRPVQLVQYSPVSEEMAGNLTLSGTNLIFIPNEGWTGSYIVQVDYTDGLSTSSAFITYTVYNNAPTKTNKEFRVHWTRQASGSHLNLLSGLIDIDGDSLDLEDVHSTMQEVYLDLLGGVTQVFYKQNESFLGDDVLQVLVTDGWTKTWLDFTVTVYNEPPAVPPATFTIHWALYTDGKLFDVMTYATDPDPEDSPSLVSTIAVNPTHGTAVVEAGRVRYKPTQGYIGQDSFSFSITDGLTDFTQQAVVQVTNARPVAVDDLISQRLHWRDRSLVFNVISNDRDIDGDVISLHSISQQPSAGTASIESASSGTIRYTVDNANIVLGNIEFRYIVSDGVEQSTPAKVTLIVTNNNVPSAPNLSYSIHWRQLTNSPPRYSVYSSQKDLDGDTNSLTITQPTLGGTTQLVTSGGIKVIEYSHDDWSQPESFTYSLSDGLASATGTITVNAYNNAPTGSHFAFDYVWEEVYKGLEIDVLRSAADEDILDRNHITVTAGSAISTNFQGEFSVIDNVVFYQPKPITGVETFSYIISDGNKQNEYTISVNVLSAGYNPYIMYFEYNWRDVLGDGQNFTLFANTTDVDNDNLQILSLVSGPTKGNLLMDGTNINYSQETASLVREVIEFDVSDGSQQFNMQVIIRVENQAPRVPAISISQSHSSIDGYLDIDIVSYATDRENDPLHILDQVDFVSEGISVSKKNDSSVTVIVPDNLLGTFYFVAYVSDGLESTSATVSLEITNQVPDVPPSNITVHWRSLLDGYDLTQLLDSAVDDDPLSIVDLFLPASQVIGEAAITSPTIIHIKSSDEPVLGSASITFIVTDQLVNVTSFVEITVENMDPYQSSAGTGAFNVHWKSVNATINLLQLFTDDDVNDQGRLQIVSATSQRASQLFITEDGSELKYTPPPRYTGNDVVTFYVTDGISAPILGTATIVVENNAPVPKLYNNVYRPSDIPGSGKFDYSIVDDTIDADATDEVRLLPSFSSSNPSLGTVAITGGVLSFTPTYGAVGLTTITFTVTDELATVPSTISIRINNVSPVVVSTAALQAHWRALPQVLSVSSYFSDSDGDTVIVMPFTTASQRGGSGTKSSNSAIQYTPPGNFKGTDTLRVPYTDGWSDNSHSFTINVFNNVPNVPATADYSIHHSRAAVIPIIADQASDADTPDFPNLVLATSNTFSGSYSATVTRSADGKSINITPVTGSLTRQDITYTITDGRDTASGLVRVSITNTIPAANDFTKNIHWSTYKPGVSLNLITESAATDTDGDSLVVTLAASPSPHGTLSAINSATGVTQFFPAFGNLATTSFRFTISDRAQSVTRTATFTIYNSVPTAVADSTTKHWRSNSFTMDLLANDVSTDGDVLTIQNVQTSLATISADSTYITFSKTPITIADLTNPTTFQYTITDGLATSSAQVTVQFYNSAPTFTSSAISDSLPWSNTNYFKRYTVTYTDGDAEDAVSSYMVNGQTLTTSPIALTYGNVRLSSGNLLYTPNSIPAYSCTGRTCSAVETFTLSVTDGLQTTTQGASITLTNTRPNSFARSYTVSRGSGSVFSGLLDIMAPEYSSYVDENGNNLSINIIRATAPLTAAVSGNMVQVQAPLSASGTSLTFTYQLSDGQLFSAEADVTVTFSSNTPACTSGTYSVNKNTNLDIQYNTCTDADGDSLVYFVNGVQASATHFSLQVVSGSNLGYYQFNINKQISGLSVKCLSSGATNTLSQAGWSTTTWVGGASPNCNMGSTIELTVTLQGGTILTGQMPFVMNQMIFFYGSSNIYVPVAPPSSSTPTVSYPSDGVVRVRSSQSLSNFVLSFGVSDGVYAVAYTATVSFVSRPPVATDYTWSFSSPTYLPSTYELDYLASATITDADGDTPTITSIDASSTCPSGSLSITAGKKLQFVLPSSWTTSNTCVAKIVISDQSAQVAATAIGTVNLVYTKSNLIARDDYGTIAYNQFQTIQTNNLLINDEDPDNNLQFHGWTCVLSPGVLGDGNYCPSGNAVDATNRCDAFVIEYQIRSGTNTAVTSKALLYVEVTGCSCSAKHEVMFAIQNSNAVSSTTYTNMKNVAVNVASSSSITMNPNSLKFGGITFSDSASTLIDLENAKGQYTSAWNNAGRTGSLSGPKAALQLAKTRLDATSRSDAVSKNVIMLIANEPSTPCVSPCSFSTNRCMPCANPTTEATALNVKSSDGKTWLSKVIMVPVSNTIRTAEFMSLARSISYDGGDRAIIPIEESETSNVYSQLTAALVDRICNNVVVPRPTYDVTIRAACNNNCQMYINGVLLASSTSASTIMSVSTTIRRGDVVSFKATRSWSCCFNYGIQFEMRVGSSQDVFSSNSFGWACGNSHPSRRPTAFRDFPLLPGIRQASRRTVSGGSYPLGSSIQALWHPDASTDAECAFAYGYEFSKSHRAFTISYLTLVLASISWFMLICILN